ncbi:MAG: glycosyltransferase family 4 protein [Phycisphaerales bacterium]|nr:MAG: glycosyltransferase family 4 protein [Phycisphaerales bacterium]
MKIVQISPGSGDNFYCENCLRDAALVKATRKLGHDVLMVPLYLPLQADKTEQVSNAPIFFGGVNVFLQQKLALFRKTPRWVDKLFDSRRLLEWAGRKAGMTRAKDLAETTISMLEGEHGHQVKELDRLVNWLLETEHGPDVVCLSNILLGGLARRIKERLRVPVVCLLQDEDGFLDGLTSPHAEQAWEIVRRRASDVDGFIAVSTYFARTMQERLAVDSSRMHVVHMGIDFDAYTPASSAPTIPTIGFLSRMCFERGLDTLIDAFILLKKNDGLKNAKLRISGGRSQADAPFIDSLRRKLTKAGALDDVEFLGAFDGAAKLDFLRSLSVLSVPEKGPVAYGLYVLEALATSVPVVAPGIGCFPETIEMTGGGLLYEPNTAEKLAEMLAPLLLDAAEARKLGAAGREGMSKTFRVEHAAARIIQVCERIAQQPK